MHQTDSKGNHTYLYHKLINLTTTYVYNAICSTATISTVLQHQSPTKLLEGFFLNNSLQTVINLRSVYNGQGFQWLVWGMYRYVTNAQGWKLFKCCTRHTQAPRAQKNAKKILVLSYCFNTRVKASYSKQTKTNDRQFPLIQNIGKALTVPLTLHLMSIGLNTSAIPSPPH